MHLNHNPDDPFGSAFSHLARSIAEQVAEQVRRSLQPAVAAPALDFAALDIHPMRAYSASEVASFLGTEREQSIYEIPADLLPRVRRIGRNVGFLGINVLCYMHGLPPVDVPAAIEMFRTRVVQDRPPAHTPSAPAQAPLPSTNQRTRVL